VHTAVDAYSRPASFVGSRIAVSLMHEKIIATLRIPLRTRSYLIYSRSRFRRSNPRDCIYPCVSIATKISHNTECNSHVLTSFITNYCPRILTTSEKDDVRAEENPNRKMGSKVMSLLEEEVLDKLGKRGRERILLRSNAVIV